MPDPMTIGAAATRSAPMPLPTPLRRQSAAPRRRYYKALLVGGLGAVALGVLALSSGAWHGMPALALEAPAIERLAGSAPTPPNTEAAPAREAGPTRPAPELPSNPPEREPVDPTALLATEPPAAGPPVARPVTVPARAPAFPSVPRAACAGRTEFALYRCMQQQCKGPAWAAHPQCVKLRETDEVG